MSRRRPHRDDLVICVAGLAAGVLSWRLGLYNDPATGAHRGALVLVPLAVMAGAELLRRIAPLTGLAVGVFALAADVLAGSLLVTVVMFSDLVYAAACYGPRRVARTLVPASVACSVAVTVGVLVLVRGPEALVVGAVLALVTLAPTSSGLLVRSHREAADAERLRAEQTALLAEMDRTQAVAAERARVARELHDVVAGHLSAIAIHATAALSREEAEPRRQALGVIRENSTQGLAEMRRLIGILREAGDATGDGTGRPVPTGPADPVAPTLGGVDALVARSGRGGAAAGLRFTLVDEVSGAGPLPAPVELAGYRIVQEALANAVRHAAPGTVRVELRITDGALMVAVRSPLGESRSPRVASAGAGLVGMAERADLLGGTFTAGPEGMAGSGEAWWVRARLPLAGATATSGRAAVDEGHGGAGAREADG
ncbi:sensor histidine kinase [Streptomyces spiramenti]|uniref:histidine kinase n=1 Tax=Streptomyces spiramenti TaxID=2720606 RepID=A0ABX1AFJ3_9ACTN|nr:histidine kinase [Streptomyces spiramenti]NJP65964.1 two-component sensor histidine kinase [Streptomyces spiramenti]